MKTRRIDLTRLNGRAARDLIFIAALAVAAFLFAALTGIFEPYLRSLATFLPFRGGLVAMIATLFIGLLVFTARRWRDAELVEQEYREMFERAQTGYFQSTPEGRFVRANQTLADLLGYESPHELTDSAVDIANRMYVDPQQRAECTRLLETTGYVRDFESQLYRKDRRIIWTLGNARTVRDRRGKIRYYEGSLVDITARKETEKAYRQLVDESLQGILIFQEGHFVFANQAAADLFGMPAERIIALSPSRMNALIEVEDRTLVWTRIQERLDGKNVPSRMVFQIVRPNEERRWVELAANRIDYRGEAGVLAVMVDITERTHAQQAMERNIENTRLREDLSTGLGRAGNNLNAVSNTLARMVAQSVGDLCIVSLVTPDQTRLEPVAYAHRDPTWQDTLRLPKPETRSSVEHPYVREVLRGETVLLPQLDDAILERVQFKPYADYVRRAGAHSYLAVPLPYGGRVIGMLSILREGGGEAYSARDENLLKEFAERAAPAIANAQVVRELHSELEARRQAEAQYRVLVEQLPAIAYIVSAHEIAKTSYVSPQIQQLGFTADEWTTDPYFWIQRVHPDDVERVLAEGARARINNIPFHSEYRLCAKDGSYHWIRDDATMVRDDNGQALYQHGIMLDISGEKHADAALRERVQELEALQATVASITSLHELPRLLDGICERAARLLGAPSAGIYLCDPVTRTCEVRGGFNTSSDNRGIVLHYGEGAAGRVAATGAPLMIEDYRHWEGRAEIYQPDEFVSVLTVPMLWQEEVIGTLNVNDVVVRHFTAREQQLLMTFAQYAAIAVTAAARQPADPFEMD